eukprot:scaffold17307_cov170-Amphora_coffeaeformis.AAC.1
MEQDTSGLVQPPPMDPLDGLEVILEGTFTVGTLRSIPSRRFPRGKNMFVEDIPDFVSNFSSAQDDNFVDVTRVPLAGGLATGDVYEPRRTNPHPETPMTKNENESAVVAEWEREDPEQDINTGTVEEEDGDEAALEQARLEAEAAQKAAEEAAAEAERKAAKMEMLRKRAEEAMARRKAKKNHGDE